MSSGTSPRSIDSGRCWLVGASLVIIGLGGCLCSTMLVEALGGEAPFWPTLIVSLLFVAAGYALSLVAGIVFMTRGHRINSQAVLTVSLIQIALLYILLLLA